MLKDKEFGAAIDKAIKLKIESGGARSKAEIARHFGVQPPSLSDWVKRGTIGKDKLSKLWEYFSDVTGPEHWGMTPSEWPIGLTDDSSLDLESSSRQNEAEPPAWPLPLISEKKIRSLKPDSLISLQTALLIAAAQVGLDIKEND